MSQLRRSMWRTQSKLGDVEAALHGSVPFAKRMVRKQVYRHVNRGTRALLRATGLSR